MNKKELLFELSTNTYLILKPSPIHGIGVFAIRDIPRGCRNMFSKPDNKWIKVTKDEVNRLPGYIKSVIKTYCVNDHGNYYVPNYGFKIVDLVNFLNESDNPNVIPINDGNYFEAIRDIKSGEELFIRYSDI